MQTYQFAAEVHEDSAEVLFMPDATAEDWAQVFSVAQVRSVSAGLAVVQAGEQERALYLLTEGTLGVRLPRAEHVFKTIDAPAVVGEVAFFDGLPRSATLEAVTDVEVVRLAPEDLDRLDAPLAQAMLHDLGRVLALRLRLVSEAIESLQE
jgi:CRP/FNR family transcriptional regulator, cyclic AMP receptor protein